MATKAQRAVLEKLIAKSKANAMFQNVGEFVSAFEQYLDSIHDDSSKVPSYSNFAKWLGDYSPSSVFQFMDNHPEARGTTAELMADAIVEHAIKGEFRDAVAIFALKNRCNWTDKRESTSVTKQAGDLVPAEEARRNVRAIMDSLGYDDRGRPRKETKVKLAEMDERIIQLAEAKAD